MIVKCPLEAFEKKDFRDFLDSIPHDIIRDGYDYASYGVKIEFANDDDAVVFISDYVDRFYAELDPDRLRYKGSTEFNSALYHCPYVSEVHIPEVMKFHTRYGLIVDKLLGFPHVWVDPDGEKSE